MKPHPSVVDYLIVHYTLPELPIHIYLGDILVGTYYVTDSRSDSEYRYVIATLDRPLPDFIGYHVLTTKYQVYHEYDDHIEFLFKNDIECVNDRLINKLGDTKLEPGIYIQPFLTYIDCDGWMVHSHIILDVNPEREWCYRLLFKDIEDGDQSYRYPKVILCEEGIFACEEFDGEEKY